MQGKVSILNSKFFVYLTSAIAIVLWGMSYIWSDALIAMNIPISYFLPIRVFTAGLVLLAFNLITRQFKLIAKHDIWKFALLSLFEPFIYFVCETYGVKLTGSPTICSLIIASVPIFSVIAGVTFFKEKVSVTNLFGVLVTLAGITLVLASHGIESEAKDTFVLGVILLFIAVLSEVGHASFTKLLSSGYPPQVIVMYQFLIGSIYLLPIFVTDGLKNFNPAVYLSWEVLRPILCLAVLCSSLAFSLWGLTIKRLGVSKSSVMLALICVSTAIIADMTGCDNLASIQWFGIFVTVLGIVFSQQNEKYTIKGPDSAPKSPNSTRGRLPDSRRNISKLLRYKGLTQSSTKA